MLAAPSQMDVTVSCHYVAVELAFACGRQMVEFFVCVFYDFEYGLLPQVSVDSVVS